MRYLFFKFRTSEYELQTTHMTTLFFNCHLYDPRARVCASIWLCVRVLRELPWLCLAIKGSYSVFLPCCIYVVAITHGIVLIPTYVCCEKKGERDIHTYGVGGSLIDRNVIGRFLMYKCHARSRGLMNLRQTQTDRLRLRLRLTFIQSSCKQKPP